MFYWWHAGFMQLCVEMVRRKLHSFKTSKCVIYPWGFTWCRDPETGRPEPLILYPNMIELLNHNNKCPWLQASPEIMYCVHGCKVILSQRRVFCVYPACRWLAACLSRPSQAWRSGTRSLIWRMQFFLKSPGRLLIKASVCCKNISKNFKCLKHL